MKLWIDDIRTPPSDDWLWARSVNQAITAIKCYERSFTSDTIYINLDHDAGDYIIQGVNGEIYPCKADIFKKTYTEDKPKTNAERIRSMTDDELNELFHEIYNAGADDASSYEWGQRTNSFEWTMDWLQQPVEEDGHDERKENENV